MGDPFFYDFLYSAVVCGTVLKLGARIKFQNSFGAWISTIQEFLFF